MSKLLQIFKIPDLRNRILVVLGWLVVFRILAAIPIPDVNLALLQDFFANNQLFGFFNIFSGGGLSNLSIAMLGVGPYITATIVMQLLTLIFPRLKQMYYEEGSLGRAKFNRWSKWLTVPLAFLSGYGFLKLLISQGVLPNVGLAQLARDTIIITGGSMLLVWIGDLITEKKIGNGISLIIFAGIVSSIPGTIQNAGVTFNPTVLTTYLAFIVVA
jgi:preprotein translocase subunit SecY